jgi:intracellular multiplication protein IcmE
MSDDKNNPDDQEEIKNEPGDEIENEFDDAFEAEDFSDDEFDEFDDLADQGVTLGELWRNNIFVKVGVIFGALAILILAIIIFGGRGERTPDSRVARSTDLTEAPGGPNELSPTMVEALEEADTARTERAIRETGSVVPTPIGPSRGTLPPQFEEPEEEDPLERWRRMQEERLRQQQLQVEEAQPPPEPEEDTRTPAVNALAQAMSQQMESVLANQQIKSPTILNIADLRYLEALEEKERQKREAALEEQRQRLAALGLATGPGDVNILLPAGSIEYAQLVTEANTDVPGPVLAEIATGPLKGARLIGSFDSTERYITLNFNTIVLDGVDYPITAVAIDPQTTLPGMATDIDRRYFKRVVLPMAAEFITGFTQAVADSGRTSVTITGDTVTESTSNTNLDRDQEVASGIAAAGEEFADILDDEADDIEPLLRIRAGTPIGVLFTAAVTDAQPAAPATLSPAAGIAPAADVLNPGIAPLPTSTQ